ncbi:MAG: trypsin-like peptidase domain-containing protein [Rothia sp. (in: high G+C Gram-positive bacteria)]|uniref:S1C family serine protease n=1 Tax=Rothia sp. (in: high G+C Gram-positive bacteria) TaxID=1885016 RepID=UPI0026DAF81E|nr:trypsin-like peptidase domain-containing protein [Rothia sp. (in: high G+C Gram-positive bacteria)]MDO4884220.1 trypsin-like peptidase domain-containing protein [Rothia sp. (in: high G+C Gram-positive bacteria)]
MTQPGWNQSYGGQQSGYNGAQYPPQYTNQQYGQSRSYSQNQQYAYAQNQAGSGNGGNGNGRSQNGQSSSESGEQKKHSTGVVLTAALLASLVGAGVGAGVGGGIAASNGSGSSVGSSASKSSGTTTSSNLNSTDPTVITETAKKVLPSTVTVSVKVGSSSGTGSGEILDTNGHILTNNHVISEESTKADQVEVRLHDGTVRTAKIVGTDPASDLAVVKIDPKGLELTPITFGDSSKLVPGDQVVALGSPYDHRDSVTVGVVASASRVMPADNKKTAYIPMIQSDAEINHGNSGGPLVNTRGELVGINTQGHRSTDGGAAAGMSFSVTSNYAKRISDEIIAKGKASHGYLGASVKTTGATTDNGKSKLFEGGVELTDISSGSPADKAGLKKGDVVVEVDGHRIEADEELNGTVRSMAPNTKATFKVQRGSETKEIQVTLGDSDSK